MPASQFAHPEFGFFCPTPCFRRWLRVALACLVVAGVGATMMAGAGRPELDAAVARVYDASIAETVPATSSAPFAAVGMGRTVIEGPHTAADKQPCVGDPRSERDCGLIKARKPRMVRVPIERPAIAAVLLGRSAPPVSIVDETIPAASASHQGNSAKSGEAVVAAANSTEPQKAAAKPKKPQRSAQRQPQRRDQNWFGPPSWREVRVDDWGARGYAPRENDYQRGGYARQGFVRNFW